MNNIRKLAYFITALVYQSIVYANDSAQYTGEISIFYYDGIGVYGSTPEVSVSSDGDVFDMKIELSGGRYFEKTVKVDSHEIVIQKGIEYLIITSRYTIDLNYSSVTMVNEGCLNYVEITGGWKPDGFPESTTDSGLCELVDLDNEMRNIVYLFGSEDFSDLILANWTDINGREQFLRLEKR